MSSSGSSSTYSFISLASGTLTMVWPVLAKPKASSAWWMCHVSWKPLMYVPWLWASRPSSGLAAHADVAVADGEQRLGQAEVGLVVLPLDEPPRVDREAVQVEVARAPWSSRRTRPPARRGRRRRRRHRARGGPASPAPRSTPTTSPNGPARPAATPDTASSTTTARSLATPSCWPRRGGRCRAPACRRGARARRPRPSTTTSKRGARPAASSTGPALRDDDTTANDLPSAVSWSSRRTEPGYGAIPSVLQQLVEQLVLAVAEGADGAHARRVVSVALGQRMSPRRRNERTPSKRGLPST